MTVKAHILLIAFFDLKLNFTLLMSGATRSHIRRLWRQGMEVIKATKEYEYFINRPILCLHVLNFSTS